MGTDGDDHATTLISFDGAARMPRDEMLGSYKRGSLVRNQRADIDDLTYAQLEASL
jgi:hypothetical protein